MVPIFGLKRFFKQRKRLLMTLLVMVVLVSKLLSACTDRANFSGTNEVPLTALAPQEEALLSPTAINTTLPTATSTPQALPQDHLPVWGTYEGPSIDPVTEIPPYLVGLEKPGEVLTWVLLGMDEEVPFTGLTPAIHVLLINPRTAKASVLSIPGSLLVYIPGYTMQRLSVVYSIGGMALFRKTLEYNFGLKVDRFVLAHPGDFEWLVDDVGGVEVSVLYPMPDACGGLASGPQFMTGNKALCYATYLSGMDEVDRLRRQQQLLRLIFLNLVDNGNLSRLPVLYASYQDWVFTDLSLAELTSYVPLALKLADPERVKYFIIGYEAIRAWQLPDNSQVQVFLPDQQAVLQIIKNAVDVVMIPSPLTDLVTTLEHELTAAVSAEVPESTPTPTQALATTPTSGSLSTTTPTPTRTPTPIFQPTSPLYP